MATPRRTCAGGWSECRAAAFLCSDEAAGIEGTLLVVDGGYIAAAEFFA